MKKLSISILTLAMLLSLIAYSNIACSNAENRLDGETKEEESDGDSHKHDWIDATCTEPKTCKDCGSTQGDPNDHSYENNICTVCGDMLPSKGLSYALFTSNGETYAMVNGIGDCTDTDIVIGSTYKGVPVTRICLGAFYDNDGITSATIPDSVTVIESQAFANCGALKTVKIGKNVEEIQDYAFSDCGELTTMNIPKSVVIMGKYVFHSVNSLTDIYCEAKECPAEWNYWWNNSSANIHWGND